jgi:hypothetical protein
MEFHSTPRCRTRKKGIEFLIVTARGRERVAEFLRDRKKLLRLEEREGQIQNVTVTAPAMTVTGEGTDHGSDQA